MSPRELGRRAALLHLKMAQDATTSGSSGTSPGATAPKTGGAGSATTLGAKPAVPNVGPATTPAIPNVPTSPAASGNVPASGPHPATSAQTPAAPNATAPPAPAPHPPAGGGGGGGGGFGSLFGGGGFSGMMTPQMLGQVISNPAISGAAEKALQFGGMPLLAAGSNMLLGGGKDLGNIMKGSIGGVTAGA